MVATAILVAYLLTAAVTDVRSRRIFNWTTYPGILTGFLTSGVATWAGVDDVQGTVAQRAWWGFVPLTDSLTGFLACFAVMLVCYVFFPGGVGGGDVKLVAMIGAFLGLYSGVEALLWTFVFGGCQALITLIWRVGALQVARQAFTHLRFALRFGGYSIPPAKEQSKAGETNMFLSPSALAAVLVVRFQLLEWLQIP
jgi:prepilin peptidase CpaA